MIGDEGKVIQSSNDKIWLHTDQLFRKKDDDYSEVSKNVRDSTSNKTLVDSIKIRNCIQQYRKKILREGLNKNKMINSKCSSFFTWDI